MSRVPDWVHDAVVYHVLVDRFARSDGGSFPPDDELPFLGFVGGTLRGVIDRLDHVAELGADTLLLSPIFPAEMHVCYDHMDLFSVEPRLGSMDDVRTLLERAHAMGIRVLLDIVLSYFGRRHPRVRSALADPASPDREWFRYHPSGRPVGWRGSLRLIAVDHTSPRARAHLLDAVRFWLAVGFDGFRLDSAHEAPLDFWEDVGAVLGRTNPDAFAYGEVMRPADERRRYRGRIHGTIGVGVVEALRRFCGDRSIGADELDRRLRAALDLPDGYVETTYVDGHDLARFEHVAGGNRARLEMALGFLFALPGPPILYYGTEVGLRQPGSGEVDLVARTPMRWGDGDRNLLAAVRHLIAYRRAHPALRRGTFVPLVAREDVYAFERRAGDDRVLVVVNAGRTPQGVTVPAADGSEVVRVGPSETRMVPR